MTTAQKYAYSIPTVQTADGKTLVIQTARGFIKSQKLYNEGTEKECRKVTLETINGDYEVTAFPSECSFYDDLPLITTTDPLRFEFEHYTDLQGETYTKLHHLLFNGHAELWAYEQMIAARSGTVRNQITYTHANTNKPQPTTETHTGVVVRNAKRLDTVCYSTLQTDNGAVELVAFKDLIPALACYGKGAKVTVTGYSRYNDYKKRQDFIVTKVEADELVELPDAF